ncbi:MAG: phosphoglycerate kinase [Candidatus Zixiibacteriota bacterium]|jgi:phosphoglycerate kinase
MPVKTIDDVDVAGKRVLVRADLNVPLSEGRVADDTRIVATLPTVKKLIADGGRVILCSHLGRPKGEVKPEYSLAPVADILREKLGQDVAFVEACGGPEAEAAANALADGDVLLLENTRFWPGETDNDPAFAKGLAVLADVFVDDAFGTAHRKHASNYGVAELVKPAVAGYLLAKEIQYFDKLLENPPRPLIFVLGGAKLSTKLAVVTNMLEAVDHFLIGGGMAYTFLKARGHNIGSSLVEDDFLGEAEKVLAAANEKIELPGDHVIAAAPDDPVSSRAVDCPDIPDGYVGVDIGAETTQRFTAATVGAGAIFWNGPMGVFEVAAFADGTREVARAIADSGAVTVAGGGETVQAARQFGVADRLSHISTGGGASLKYLEGKPLAAIEVLDRK